MGSYNGLVRDVVLRMKQAAGESLAWAAGRLLAERYEEHFVSAGGAKSFRRPDIVAPVPMHWLRRVVRGTNSPEILASCLANRLGSSLARRLLGCCRNIRPQKDLTVAERFQNVRGAFRLRKCYDVEGRNVMLVDDVLTTGATCSALAEIVKRAGAASVVVAVAARADGPDTMI